MKYRIKISERDYLALRAHFQNNFPREAAAFLLTGVSVHGGTTDILVRRVIEVPSEDFDIQEQYQLRVAARAINGLMALCDAGNVGAGFCHSHPEYIPYSYADDRGERRLSETAKDFCPPGVPVASILFYPDGIVSARIWIQGEGKPIPVDEIIIVGRCIKKIDLLNDERGGDLDRPMFSRQILAFGEEGQKTIQGMKVVIVGVGATGSACAEQLIRLGVNDFVLIDADHLEASNLSRVYGSFPFDKEMAPSKVDAIREHLSRINPDAKIKPIFSRIQDVGSELRDRDVIFLCVDEDWARATVNQICYQYLIPTINMGVRIDAEKGHEIAGGVCIVDVLRPDKPCLWCKQSLSSDRIAAEAAPSSMRESNRGYVQGLDTPAPMVIPFTSLAASLAVNAFLQIATNYLGTNWNEERISYFILENDFSHGKTPIDATKPCICRKVKGKGDLVPLD